MNKPQMPIKSILKIALKSLMTHKSRSALTILGVVIGVMSIVIIVAVGRGAEGLIANEVTSLGADIVWIEPGHIPGSIIILVFNPYRIHFYIF